jgi:multidrug efflux pump subunit AcrB
MPEGTALEETMAAAEAISRAVLADPAVTDIQLYVGTAAPFTFNGLVRHYYGRRGSHEAEIQVNLTPRGVRHEQSHAIAARIRQAVAPAAQSFGANVKTVEVPPGPPVLQTLVAEIYGPGEEGRLAVARQVRDVLKATANVVDVDWYVTDPHPELRVELVTDKATALGVSPQRVRQVLEAALRGTTVGLVRDPQSREDVPLVVRLPQSRRTSESQLAALGVHGTHGVVSLGEIARIRQDMAPAVIYHKNLFPVVYVTADMAGGEESPIYAMLRAGHALDDLAAQGRGAWQRAQPGTLPRLTTSMPAQDHEYVLKWDGEWQITYEVFRDMGLAFAAVLVLIALLVVGWFGSYTTPIAIMAPIPLSLIGIIPAHALTGAFFTATSMIGFIAGAGIVVRNSIILVDFIELRRSLGVPLAEAVVEAGALRFRPMLLTAASVVAGAFVILFDPIFQGLAISLMAGEVAATLFSRLVVPVLYYLEKRHEERHPTPQATVQG